MNRAALLVALALAGCSGDKDASAPATLYRNSPIDPTMRVLFASFDAPEKGDYNISNCGMAARTLNANVKALADAENREYDPGLGFWCESGRFEEHGHVPVLMQKEFPTDSTGSRRW